MRTRKTSLLSFAFALLSGCATVQVPNTRVCAVAGRFSAGMDCAYTQTDQTESMTMDEALDFLEPQVSPERGPALCQSSEDWVRMKTALEQACTALGRKCTTEVKQSIAAAAYRVDALRALSISKRKDHP